jgi:hypothetical protein
MAFQLFVDPTAGARSAADSIMQGAKVVGDRLKERREEKKKERKLFDSYVTQASALGLGEGETEKERMDDLRTNQTPESLQGMVEGTKLKIYQDMQQANIDNTKARTAETKRATRFAGNTEGLQHSLLEGQVAGQKANISLSGMQASQIGQNMSQAADLHLSNRSLAENQSVFLGEQIATSKADRKQKAEEAPVQKRILEEKLKASEDARGLAKRKMDNEDAKTAIYGINAHTAKMQAGTAQQQAANQKQEQDRLDKINNMPKGMLNPAIDKSSGKVIPGLYMTNEGKMVPWESDLANMSPEQSELARLKGALVTLEGMPDDQEVDVDGGNELRDLAPVGWFGGLFSSGEDKSSIVRERVRGKIAELEAKTGGGGGRRRVTRNPDGTIDWDAANRAAAGAGSQP